MATLQHFLMTLILKYTLIELRVYECKSNGVLIYINRTQREREVRYTKPKHIRKSYLLLVLFFIDIVDINTYYLPKGQRKIHYFLKWSSKLAHKSKLSWTYCFYVFNDEMIAYKYIINKGIGDMSISLPANEWSCRNLLDRQDWEQAYHRKACIDSQL